MATRPGNWEVVKALFEAALEMDSSQRSEFLRNNCPDAGTLAEVERLLNEYDQAVGFLLTPAPGNFSLAEAGLPQQKLSAGEVLAGRFRIVRFIAGGGMGEVYEAEDQELRDRVAAKIIRPEVLSQPNAVARFKREVHLARKVTHPNVCRIFDLFRHKPDGGSAQTEMVFISMELLEGETLGTRLKAKGRMNVDEALPLVQQMASALAAAHAVGIVHRDFKPGNVVLVSAPGPQRERAVVTDFGLALRSITSDETASLPITGQGLLGTPAYMAPEQLEGRLATPASDVYALGLIIYEMITGVRPFQGDTPLSAAVKRLSETPVPPRKLQPQLSPVWESVILRCLEREPTRRFQSAESVNTALMSGEPVSLTQGGARTSETRQDGNPQRSIAVLPFANSSKDPENEFFADGISEEIMNALTQIKGLRVAGRTSSFHFRGRNADLEEIRRRLRVETILEGSVRKSGNRLRITARLVNVSDGYQIWSERYDRELQDVFEVQEEIARCIVARLKVTLRTDQETLTKIGTANFEAYQLYLKARVLLYQRGLGIPRSLELFSNAVQLDSEYAQAWAGLCEAHCLLAYYGFAHPKQSLPLAKQAGLRAVSIDPALAEAHSALAFSYLWEFDWERAEREYVTSIELNPHYLQARAGYALYFLSWVAGRFDDAIPHAKAAVESDPLSAYATTVLAIVYLCAGRFAEGKDVAQRAVDLDPDAFLPRFHFLNALGLLGQMEEAIEGIQSLLSVSGRHPWGLTALAFAYSELGRITEAKAVYSELAVRAKSEYVQPYMLAVAAAAAEEPEEAINLAREAYESHDPVLVSAKYYQSGNHLRQDPRFNELLDRMGLPYQLRIAPVSV